MCRGWLISNYLKIQGGNTMVRKSTIVFLCAAAALFASTHAAFAQQQAKLQKLNPFLTATPDPIAAAATRAALDKNKGNGNLATFNYTVTSSRDGNSYTGTIVGGSPFTDPKSQTSISTKLIPVIVVTNSVFAGVDSSGNIITAPGVTQFDPTVADPCLSAPNNVPFTLIQQSPIIQTADFNVGGADIGTTQYVDAFQRSEFFQLIAKHGDNGDGEGEGGGDGSNHIRYHVILDPVDTLQAIVINIPAASGVAYPSSAFGGCPVGTEAIIDLTVLQSDLTSVLPALSSRGVNPSTFPIFSLHNVVECEGPSCSTLATNTSCCVLGFHSAVGLQTYSPSDFDTSAIFVSPVPDVSIMSHEVAEWMNDPFGQNPVPAWGHIGQQPGCQGNLEVGDPLSGTLAPPIAMPNGFTYHMQELAFFSWFYGAPSIGIHGWFSNNDTFTQDAGPVCK
jgi:hypothetical protein